MNTTRYYNERLRKFAVGRLELITVRRQEKAREISLLRELGLLTNVEDKEFDFQLRLLDRAVYSIYLDCVDAGASEEAGRLLDGLRQAVPNAAPAR